jgi:hypothetical protein
MRFGCVIVATRVITVLTAQMRPGDVLEASGPYWKSRWVRILMFFVLVDGFPGSSRFGLQSDLHLVSRLNYEIFSCRCNFQHHFGVQGNKSGGA